MNVAETTRQSIDAEISSEIEAADIEANKQAEIAEKNISKIKTQALSNIESIASDTASEVVLELIGKAPTAKTIQSAMLNS